MSLAPLTPTLRLALRYEIMNFQHVQPGVYDYINIGSWHEGLLSLDEEMIRMNRSDMVRSVCSEPCSKGEIKVTQNRPTNVVLRPRLQFCTV